MSIAPGGLGFLPDARRRCAKRDHCHRVALYTVWYNFVRMHKTIRMTPALAAEVENRLWSLEELVGRTSL